MDEGDSLVINLRLDVKALEKSFINEIKVKKHCWVGFGGTFNEKM